VVQIEGAEAEKDDAYERFEDASSRAIAAKVCEKERVCVKERERERERDRHSRFTPGKPPRSDKVQQDAGGRKRGPVLR
jgi:hypothetical protein